ncbi:MAG: MFS transporter [Caldilineaceae bacterium]|nr:MFS transporter [Caldilineaceae bacterium]
MTFLLKPFGGRIGDRFGFRSAISLGMLIIGLSLALLAAAAAAPGLLLLAIGFGVGQALVFPSTVALVADEIRSEHMAPAWVCWERWTMPAKSLARSWRVC